MKIENLVEKDTVLDDDYLIVDGSDGTKKAKKNSFLKEMKEQYISLKTLLGSGPIADANDISNSNGVNTLQVFRVSSETANIPQQQHGVLLHMFIDNENFAIQMYIRLGGQASTSLYTRSKQIGSWAEWQSH